VNSPFLNKYEQVTYGKLKAVADRANAHVFAKVRLKDVIPVDSSGISDAEYGFSLRSHVDFLVTDSQYKTQFCVEFDGSMHRRPQQVTRDQMKDDLLARFDMPFIRINAMYLDDRFRGLDLLTYFADVWFLSIAFYEAQAIGLVPYDEPFDATYICSDGTHPGRSWPYWLSFDLQNTIRKLYESKRVAQMCPSHWIGEDEQGNLRCLSWLFLGNTSCAFVETSMRSQRFPAVYGSEVLSQIAVFDLYDRVRAILRGQARARDPRRLADRFAFYKNQYAFRESATCTQG